MDLFCGVGSFFGGLFAAGFHYESKVTEGMTGARAIAMLHNVLILGAGISIVLESLRPEMFPEGKTLASLALDDYQRNVLISAVSRTILHLTDFAINRNSMEDPNQE